MITIGFIGFHDSITVLIQNEQILSLIFIPQNTVVSKIMSIFNIAHELIDKLLIYIYMYRKREREKYNTNN